MAPIPGLPIAYMMSVEIIKKTIDLAETVSDIYDKASKAGEAIQGIQELKAALTGREKLEGAFLQTSTDEKGKGPVDMHSMRLLAGLLARGLAQRYEEVLTCRLEAPAEESVWPLARVGAKRCFQYLHDQSFFDEKALGTLLAQRTRLLNSVSLGQVDKSWRERAGDKLASILPRFIRELQIKPLNLKSGVRPSKASGKFTAEGIYLHSAWYDEKSYYEAKQKPHETEYWGEGASGYSKYGFAYLEVKALTAGLLRI